MAMGEDKRGGTRKVERRGFGEGKTGAEMDEVEKGSKVAGLGIAVSP